MSRIVLLYMSREGQTRKIMDRMAGVLSSRGHECSVVAVDAMPAHFSLSGFDAFVLGCSIRYGKHHQAFCDYVEANAAQLNSKPVYFFSVNLTARKPHRSQPHNNRYLVKYLARSALVPDQVEVFAGALKYSTYDLFNKCMIQLIMKLTGGSTDTSQDIEFTNWRRVIAFAESFEAFVNDQSGLNTRENSNANPYSAGMASEAARMM
ncbi:MAG: menaquinone-dependent protoporphyrinogen IX dehydrogenase [Endozoicomonas sp.]